MQAPTVSDVARLAGVSTATVSRALSGTAAVNEKTRQRVLKAAAELGYTRNALAGALRSKTSGVVGMVVPSISNPFFTALVESVEHELQSRGKTLFLCDSKGDVALEAVRLQSLRESHVDGIIISPCHGVNSAPALNSIPKSTPVVQLDQFVVGTASDWVGLDDEKAMELLLSHVAELGAVNAVFVSSDSTNSSTEARLAGFRRNAERLGIHVGPDDILLGGFTVEWGEEAARRLIARPELPDIVICGADVIAFGVMRELAVAGVPVPQRVMVTGFDDITFASIIRPSLTTIRQPTNLLAAEAVRMLYQDRAHDETSYAKVALTPQLVVRESTAPAPSTVLS